MVSPVFISALVTIVPAMAAIWWFLRRYEGYFEDARVFFSLTAGLFAGLVASAFEFYTGFGDSDFVAAAGAGTAFIFFVMGYSFFEAGIKTMVLGLGRFRSRRDTPYYGMAFGLGFGSMVALLVLANAIRISLQPGFHPYTLPAFIFLVLLVVGVVLAHGATATWVGKGSADGKLWRGWGLGMLLQAPVWGTLWLYWPSIGQGNIIVPFPGILSAVYGAGILLAAQQRILDQVVPQEIKDQLRREKRREARGHGRAEDKGATGAASAVGAGAAGAAGAGMAAAAAASDAEE